MWPRVQRSCRGTQAVGVGVRLLLSVVLMLFEGGSVLANCEVWEVVWLEACVTSFG